jgi:hypothetical protein
MVSVLGFTCGASSSRVTRARALATRLATPSLRVYNRQSLFIHAALLFPEAGRLLTPARLAITGGELPVGVFDDPH